MVDSSFHDVNRLFVLSFGNDADRIVHTGYFLPTIETKDYNVRTDGRDVFDQIIKMTERCVKMLENCHWSSR